MLTDLQLKKLPKMFVLNDNNGDGIIAQEDYEEAARVPRSFPWPGARHLGVRGHA